MSSAEQVLSISLEKGILRGIVWGWLRGERRTLRPKFVQSWLDLSRPQRQSERETASQAEMCRMGTLLYNIQIQPISK